MAARSQPSRSDKTSIKYRWSPLEVACFELSDLGQEENVSTLSDSRKQSIKQSEPKPSEILSTAEFVSAVGRIWDCATRPLSVLQPKANVKHDGGVCQKENIPCYLGRERNNKGSASGDTKSFCIDSMSPSCFPHVVNSNFELMNVNRKISLFEPCNGYHRHSFFSRYLQVGDFHVPEESWKAKGLASVQISCDLGQIYEWMSEKPFHGPKYPANVTQIKNKKSGVGCISGDVIIPANNLSAESTDSNLDSIKCKVSSSVETGEFVENAQMSVTSLYVDYSLRAVLNSEAKNPVSRSPSSSLYSDYHIDLLASFNCASEECQHAPVDDDDDDNILENGKKQIKELVLEGELAIELCPSVQDKPGSVLANQRHAFAGALAGTFVSLCLHPVDTIKTVIQSCGTDQKSISHVVGTIISERGALGLYRGIASNIASSAPISAVYTFTYESVKGALLPILPKEYYSFAHCIAGGCASIATSFIFTPSERIKQQMQVGLHYQNCLGALVGILGRGGLRSLYAGWGAILCRNIPHSIIKFYTYESLKQLMLSSAQPNARPNTLQTLVCGGLAGSTAAFFTTPFDVVKTRLQTQIPGSLRQYDGVFHTLQEIAKHEGVKGLYRGLTPRLVMYVSQGALFFASYEFFKSTFSLEVQQLCVQTVQTKQNMEADSTSLPSLSSSSSPPPPPPPAQRLPSLHS